jgi:23S rRNA pseudouridine1911/1915/1917 synthase
MVASKQDQNSYTEPEKVEPPSSAWEITIPTEHIGERMDKWLARPDLLGSRSKAKKALDRGKIFLNGAEATLADAGRWLREGDKILFWMDRPGTAKIVSKNQPHRSGLWVVYEDNDLIVINKPAGLLVHPLDDEESDKTLITMVENYLRPHGKRTPFLVHRIDKDTSGLVIFAKHVKVQSILKGQFKHRKPERIYWAIVHGVLKEPTGIWTDWLLANKKTIRQQIVRPGTQDAVQAISEYKVLEQFSNATLLEVRLVTGKRNQIRIQAGSRGYPLVGEKQYVFTKVPESWLSEFDRQALHAIKLTVGDPWRGKPLVFEAPLPEDMSELLENLRETNKPRKNQE